MPAVPRLPVSTHYYIRRGHDICHLGAPTLAVMFNVSEQRIYQILADMVSVKVEEKWAMRRRGHHDANHD